MHPYLEHLSIFTLNELTESEERCISLFQEADLIPNKDDREAPACPKCHGPMFVSSRRERRLGWHWSCGRRRARVSCCNTRISPFKHTFFENTRLSFRDTLGLIVGFVMDMRMSEIQRQITEWRYKRGEKRLHVQSGSVAEFYNKLKHICETVVTRNSELMEGMGKKKSLLNCYRLKRLRALATFGERIYAILMDIKSVYPCPGKKDLIGETLTTLSPDENVASLPHERMNISSANSSNKELESLTVKNEDALLGTSSILEIPNMEGDSTIFESPSVTVKTENYSMVNENTGFLNDSTINSGASLFDHENSDFLNKPCENVCMSPEPEKPTAVDNINLLHMKEKNRITFAERLPLHKNTPYIKSESHTLANSNEKDQNISAATGKDFLSNEKEMSGVLSVLFTKNIDHPSASPNEIDLHLLCSVEKPKISSIRKEKCGVPSVRSKGPKPTGNLPLAESSGQSSTNSEKLSHIVSSENEKNISAIEEHVEPSANSKNTQLYENKQCTKISDQSSVNSKNVGCGVLSVVVKSISSNKKKKCTIPSNNSKKLKLSDSMHNTRNSEQCSENSKSG